MPKSGKYTQTLSGHAFTTRVDVDGNYPQMKVSLSIGSTYPAHWIANLSPDGTNAWEGDIWYRKDNAATLGVTSNEQITTNASESPEIPDRIRVTYGGYYASGGFYYVSVYLKKSGTNKQWYYWYKKTSDRFRDLNIEVDYESGVNKITSLNPHDVDSHRPASLPNEAITISSTFAKAGFSITESANNAVATSGAGSNSKWSNAELHDAMQAQWSKSEASQWAMWVFQANNHEDNHTGIMFDSTGNFQRCGTALFHGYSGYSGAPSGVVNRHKFHTLIHEMGHSLNLYHSWVKTSGTSNWSGTVSNESEARSYMNYPDRVNAGYYGFFDTFDYRFSDQELTFLRHAPESFVQPGGSAWGTNHTGSALGGEINLGNGKEPAVQDLQLIVRSNKSKPAYEYLEFVNLEMKLKNTGNTDQKVAKGILEDLGHMSIRVSRNGAPAKVFKPYAVPCEKEDPLATLKPGESLYDTLFLSAGKFGWAISEPGFYEVIITIHAHAKESHVNITSQPLVFSVAEPDKFNRQQRKEQEKLAQDVFTDEVGRTLAFGGTKILTGANEVLKELTERFPNAKAAKHANVALAMPNTRDSYKLVSIDKKGNKSITPQKANEKEGAQVIKKVLIDGGKDAIETIGNIAFQKISDNTAKELKKQGDNQGAKEVQQNILNTLEKSGIKLPEKVKKEMEAKLGAL